MNLGSFITGAEIIRKYYSARDGYHLAAEHDQIYLYPTDHPMTEEDVFAVKELGWFQDDVGDDDEYDPTSGWSCYV